MDNIGTKGKLVSVIVPVYNAENYLGYCLNSIVSQTYQQIEIILINDGSTDNSLAICQNYALVDDRISIITVENNGVSNARNVGLDAAKGEYIQFIDSDDVIKSNMIEQTVQMMEAYQKDVVVSSFEMITLGQNDADMNKISFSCNIMGGECVLTREKFFKKMAFILWRTSLLECSWNKLFRRSIIQENNIRFPKELTLGEDFCFNMDYFQYVNGAVFTNKVYYYYMQVNKGALTRKYRADLFDNQMYLIQRFHKLLKNNIKISHEEKKELAEYTVAKMMQALYSLTDEKCNLSEYEKKEEIAKIINNDYVRNAYKKAEYIEPRYEWIRECMEFSDIEKICFFCLDK